MANAAKKSGDPTACSPGDLSKTKVKETTFENTKLNTVKLNWKEVYYTNCPLVSASNVDQELGWTREEFKKIGVSYAFLRSRRENDWYPHYIHNLDNLFRFGGLFPPIHVHADIRRTRLLGVTHAPHEGGCMIVRSRDDIYLMKDLKGKKIGLSKSLNKIKTDWWRIQEHQGIKLMLRMNGMTMEDVQIVEFPYADDWYNDPKMLDPMENPSELWLKRETTSATWPSVRWRPHWKRVLSMRSTPKASPSSISRRLRASSRPSRTCPGIRTGLCRWPISPLPSPVPM